MTDARESRPTGTRPRLVLAAVYLMAVAVLMAGRALLSSMSGELESMGATAAEEAQWAWANGLARGGFIMVFVCAVLVFALRKLLRLTLSTAFGVVMAGVLLAGFVFFLTWSASMG